jgi:hypothetical protein
MVGSLCAFGTSSWRAANGGRVREKHFVCQNGAEYLGRHSGVSGPTDVVEIRGRCEIVRFSYKLAFCA